MKKVDILGDNRFEKYSKVREGSRGIIVRDGLILLFQQLFCLRSDGTGTDESD